MSSFSTAFSSAFDSGATSPTVLPFGPAGAGVFVAALESGAQLVLEYATEVQKTWTGTEYREAQLSQPRQTYKATALLVDAQLRDVRSAIARGAAAGSPFLLGLPWESTTITVKSTGAVASVASTAILDWAQPGQRVLLRGADGTTLQATIQSAAASSLTLGNATTGAAIALGSLGTVGVEIMPLVAIYLDPQQGFARHPITVEEWQLAARAALFGFVGTDTFGAGATVTTFADATWGATPVWDRGVVLGDSSTDSVQTLADLVDLGGVPGNVGSAPVVDFGRAVAIESDTVADRQWLKAFLAAAAGRLRRFLVPSYRPDLVPVTVGTGTLVVRNGAGYGDPGQYFASSAAQKRLWVTKTDGTVQMASVSTYTDNLDGTGTLAVSPTVTGTPAMVSFLETCRFENDSLTVTWSGAVMTFSEAVRVVQQ